MDEYISREAVLKAFRITAKNSNKDYQRGLQDAIDCLVPEVIADIPAADVQPVKRGRWIDCTFYDPYEKSCEQNFEYKCSCCGHMIYNKPNDDNQYCGHCGARMDGEQND